MALTPILTELPPIDPSLLREAIRASYHEDEDAAAARLLSRVSFTPERRQRITAQARAMAEKLRKDAVAAGGVEAFMHAYALDTEEGVALMCLAEALLRVPDVETADLLIRDKIGDTDWQKKVAASDSFLINASTYGLMLTGRLLSLEDSGQGFVHRISRMVGRLGEPVIREALKQAMKVLGHQFVLGQTIDQAVGRAKSAERQGYLYSYDMLGEAARTDEDAQRYLASYLHALERVAAGAAPQPDLFRRPSLSIKLSALHPRYEYAQHGRIMAELLPRLARLLQRARELDVAVTIDAEESDRLEPSLDLLEQLAASEPMRGWNGLGLAVQAYQKRAIHVIPWLADLASRTSRRIPVRLVKGAYWDGEVKKAQTMGYADYPVFTRKVTTDVSYLACAKELFAGGDAFYPMFATHNAQTLAAILDLAGNNRGFEFQKLHGMGDTLYGDLVKAERLPVPCRVYAPVGSHKDLLPYLVRRLLENGANSSFVHQVVDRRASLEALIADPVERLRGFASKRHPAIPRPADIYGHERRNSEGIDLSDPKALAELARRLASLPAGRAAPGVESREPPRPVCDPADRRREVGSVVFADAEAAERAMALAHRGQPAWERRPVEERAALLDRGADLFERHLAELVALCVREAGKTVLDAIADVREAVDFLRYYAAEARRLLGRPTELPGPTGERNLLSLHPRGVFVTIAPWNFPVAIFVGQLAAALAAGNSVVAKPAEATSLTGQLCCDLLHRAGIPADALVFLPGEGGVVGKVLVTDPRCAGVAFTGSTATAFAINRAMAATDQPLRPLIAETGGMNAVVVDSSALLEAVVQDTLDGAFRSAGQRCSAQRVLFVQDEIADRAIEMLTGAMAELTVGDPGQLATDVGPVINGKAQDKLMTHARRMEQEGRLLYRARLDEACAHGTFVPPMAFEIDRMSRLTEEVFGPILHVVRWQAGHLDRVVDAVAATGYGLTFGVHSRIDETVETLTSRVKAGNIYVNRNIIGAVVGTQPFGGEGLSGTGFKAGGPHYLLRFLTERTLTVNTAAVGGNLQLMGALKDEA
ncbi:bifunctional proline dehydrogenase/L-glutamate gamma-semialdehyde dehydrogenase PutA [Geminicoccus harenae]|uniref:bifunctional proline dehydrogenase/L-glutamate gamma-semialdehyde dehydrogenase PutA n=3 Tax=Geminicoccus harenae TaxID=2498453 RepID=UPI001C989655|nr:bifunctional proline dehydrogenase/L-glutamate gamma-semialdehyde dehydrogenase PutA [Geminicoccus harenae]